MKKIILASILLAVLTSCYRVKPNADQESVLVYKPWFFGHGGVEASPISTGATWCAATTDHYEFTITPVTMTEEFKNMITADNNPVSFDVYLKLQIQKGNSPILYQKFGLNWYQNNLQAAFRTMVRDKASAYKMFDLSSKREISSKLETDLFDGISTYAKTLKIPVNMLGVSIGAVTPPDEVLAETKNTAAQNQGILTQTARANAELARKQAEINKAIADKAYQSQMGMSVEQYLHLRQLEIEKEKVELIKDHANVSIIFGGSNSFTYPIK